MVFRLPTPFESFVQVSSYQSRPWRGTFFLHGVSLSRGVDGQQMLFVASAETEGDNRPELWPKQLHVYLTRQSCRLSDIQAFVRSHATPLCMLMPDRSASGPEAIGNEASFRALSRLMMDNQAICIAPWGNESRLMGSGIIIFPTTSSTGLLVGAVFLESSFPDFVTFDTSRPTGVVTTGLSSTPSYQTRPAYESHSLLDSPGQAPENPTPQGSHVRRRYDHTSFGDTKPPGNRQLPPHSLSGFPEAAALFNWPFFEDTSDGSGNTSPGSTHTWH